LYQHHEGLASSGIIYKRNNIRISTKNQILKKQNIHARYDSHIVFDYTLLSFFPVCLSLCCVVGVRGVYIHVDSQYQPTALAVMATRNLTRRFVESRNAAKANRRIGFNDGREDTSDSGLLVRFHM
jgi:hypothetical protein